MTVREQTINHNIQKQYLLHITNVNFSTEIAKITQLIKVFSIFEILSIEKLLIKISFLKF